MFTGLCKAFGQEPRQIIRQAIGILVPAVPKRMDDGHIQLTQVRTGMQLQLKSPVNR